MSVGHDRYRVLVIVSGALVGALCCYKIVSNLAFFFRRSGVGRYLPVKDSEGSESKGSWALITGSGSGLGRALASELAGLGFNIILHGSNEVKLHGVQKSLQAAFPSRSFRVLVLDARISALLDKPALAAKLDEVAKSLQDIQLRILINNVATPQADSKISPKFDTIDTFAYDDLLQNVSIAAIFPLLLTRALYPQLVHNQPSLIMNIGSLATRGTPLMPSYAPSKAFTMASATELRRENMLEGRDIEVMGIDVVGFTGSDTIKHEPTLLIPDATVIAKAMVRSIGCGYSPVAPYLPHALFLGFLDVIPSWLRGAILIVLMRSQRQDIWDKLKAPALEGN